MTISASKHGHFSFTWKEHEEISKTLIDFLEDVEIMADLGYGDGGLMKMVRERYPEKILIGLEADMSLIRLLDNNLLACYGRIESLPYRNDSMDGIVSSFVLDYLDGDDKKSSALDEIVRVLKPGGKACIYVHARESVLLDKLRETVEKNPEDDWVNVYIEVLDERMFDGYDAFRDFLNDAYRRLNIEVDDYGTWGYHNLVSGEFVPGCYFTHIKKIESRLGIM